MPEEKAIDIHDCQEWIRSASLPEVQQFLWWAQGVADGRARQRKPRDQAKKAAPLGSEDPINLKEIVK